MKYIYLENFITLEIIPEFNPSFPDIPITDRYSPEFMSHCVAVSDDTIVQEGWIYDVDTGTFSEPPEPIPPEPVPDTRSPAEKRKDTYEHMPIIDYNGNLITVDDANTRWWHYEAEGNMDAADNITTLIAAAKRQIREMFPDI